MNDSGESAYSMPRITIIIMIMIFTAESISSSNFVVVFFVQSRKYLLKITYETQPTTPTIVNIKTEPKISALVEPDV